MTVWEAVLWGSLGGLAIEFLELHTAVRRCGWPWKQDGEPGFVPYLTSVVLRVLLGAGLASAMATSDDICAPIAAFVTGMAAPIIITEKLGAAARGTSASEREAA